MKKLFSAKESQDWLSFFAMGYSKDPETVFWERLMRRYIRYQQKVAWTVAVSAKAAGNFKPFLQQNINKSVYLQSLLKDTKMNGELILQNVESFLGRGLAVLSPRKKYSPFLQSLTHQVYIRCNLLGFCSSEHSSTRLVASLSWLPGYYFV